MGILRALYCWFESNAFFYHVQLIKFELMIKNCIFITSLDYSVLYQDKMSDAGINETFSIRSVQLGLTCNNTARLSKRKNNTADALFVYDSSHIIEHVQNGLKMSIHSTTTGQQDGALEYERFGRQAAVRYLDSEIVSHL